MFNSFCSVATFFGHNGISKQVKNKKAIALSQKWISDGTLLFEQPSSIQNFETSKRKTIWQMLWCNSKHMCRGSINSSIRERI
jgi:hypothetical protein